MWVLNFPSVSSVTDFGSLLQKRWDEDPAPDYAKTSEPRRFLYTLALKADVAGGALKGLK